MDAANTIDHLEERVVSGFMLSAVDTRRSIQRPAAPGLARRMPRSSPATIPISGRRFKRAPRLLRLSGWVRTSE